MHVFVSGRPSLDLLGSLKWRHDDAEELLHSAADVRAWFRASGLGLDLAPTDDDVAWVRTVREALYRVVGAVRTGGRPARADVVLLNGLAQRPGPSLRILGTGVVRRTATVEQALAEVVRDALDLLASGEVGKVRDCANPGCTRLFLDGSRAGTRRWCGMSECGNAAKVAAFRARRKASAPS